MKKMIWLLLVVVLLAALYYFWQRDETTIGMTKEEAIRIAKDYKPDGVCTQALVDAVHDATGATFTFPNGCLPPGWRPEK